MAGKNASYTPGRGAQGSADKELVLDVQRATQVVSFHPS